MFVQLIELEKKHKEETRLWEKTEKKLKYLKKKLDESLRISISPALLDHSEQQSTSSVSENSIVSSESSTNTNYSGIRIPIQEDEERKISESSTSKQTLGVPLAEENYNSSVGDFTGQKLGPTREECKTDERRYAFNSKRRG